MPDLVVEDGTVVAGSNGYVSTDDFQTYCDNHGYTIPSNDDDLQSAAIIRATQAIDGAYRMNYPGYRTVGRQQTLEWPRTAAYDYEGIVIDTKVIPIEIVKATCEAALREMTTPGIMQPDLKRGGFIRSVRAGSVAIQYGGNNNRTIFSIIDQIMYPLLGNTPSAKISGIAMRG